MGLLAKIFNTDKLEYILREEEEFTVDAPKEWNVELLTVGDTITPDMWDKQKFIVGDFWGVDWYGIKAYDKTIQDSYLIQSMFFDEGGDEVEADWMVSLNSTTTGKSFGIIGTPEELSILNSLLKDNYKIVSPDINESNDDFTVAAPEGWNITELTVGDTITPDMWDQNKISEQLNSYLSKPIQILWIEDYKFDDGSIEFEVNLEIKDHPDWNQDWNWDWELNYINYLLKPEYKIVVPDDLNESEDEFSVAAPEGWNITELGIGDSITFNMLQPGSDLDRRLNRTVDGKLTIIGFQWDNDLVVFEGFFKPNTFEKENHEEIHKLGLYYLNKYDLKPQYKIVPPLTEQDEFDVDVPEGWNVKELTVGDRITPDMLKNPDRHDYELNYFLYNPEYRVEIKKVDVDQFGEYVVLYITTPEDIVREVRYLSVLNNLLKPDYQIFSPTNINESEDEFSVEAPEEWNEIPLTVGDSITPDMWNKQAVIDAGEEDEFLNNENWIIRYIGMGAIEMESDEGGYIDWGIDNAQSLLKPQYRIVDSLNESDDFNVDAPEEWDKEYLQVGDIITPDMWDNIHGFKFREPVYIIDVGTDDGGDYVLLSDKPHSDGYDSTWDLDEINYNLKHPYVIVNDMNESDDFNVDSPEEWNYYYLTAGDTITPDMWDKTTPAREIRLRSFLYDPDQEWTFKFIPDYPDRVMMTSKGGVHIVLEIKIVNSLLKHQYQIDEPLNEQDEFNVVAPKDWNIQYLGVGDYLDSSNLKMQNSRKKFEIVKIFKNMWGNSVLLNVHELVEEPIPGTIRTNKQWKITRQSTVSIEDLENKMKPGFKIDFPDSLNELDDDWSVEAPPEWDVFPIIITMTNEYTFYHQWDEDHDQLDEVKVIKTDSKELEEIIGQSIPYDAKAIENLIGREFWDNDELMEFLHEGGKIVQAIPEDFYEEGWASQWEDYTIDVKLPSKINENEFDVVAPEEWNIGNLKVGDKLTSSMFKPNTTGYFWNENAVKVTILKINYKKGTVTILFEFPSGHSTKSTWDLYSLNSELTDGYKIEDPSLSEGEFDVVAPEEWNQEEFTGTTDEELMEWIEKILLKHNVEQQYIDDYINEVFSYGDPDAYDGITEKELLDDVNEYFEHFNDLDNDNLEESNGEFNVDAPIEWDYELLTVGDVVTPDMWSDDVNNMSSIKEFNKILKKPFIIKDISRSDRGDDIHYLIKLDNDIYIHSRFLKPQYKIVPNLNENEDEFNVEAPYNWNVTELTVGDTITPDMWEEINDHVKWQNNPIIITKFVKAGTYNDDDPAFIVFKMPESYEIIEDVDYINDLLKDEYLVVKPLNESEDEFRVTAPKEWNQKEITTGDTFKIKDTIYQIGEFDPDGRHVGVKRKKDNKYLTFPISLVQNKLPKNTILVKPITKLSELLETDDDFTVDAPKEWNEIYLTIGDQITPEMWDQQAVIDAGDEDFLNSKTWTINDFVSRWIRMTSSGGTDIEWDVKDVQSLLKPQYRIVSSINESDDEFNVDAPKEWGITQLTKGDTITPDMWKNIDESLTNWFKELGAESPTDILIKEIRCWDREDKDCMVRLILKNKSFSLKNIIKKSYYDSFGSPTYNSGWFDWDEWKQITELNDLLKPQYQIVSPENLHESDDEFNEVSLNEE